MEVYFNGNASSQLSFASIRRGWLKASTTMLALGTKTTERSLKGLSKSNSHSIRHPFISAATSLACNRIVRIHEVDLYCPLIWNKILD